MTHATMIPTHSRFNRVVAFEVSKDRLVVHILPADRQRTIANKLSAIHRLLRLEAGAGDDKVLVVCEATGGYERHVLVAAAKLGLACHRAHGSRVRSFANYLGLAAKTDRIDARMLALYGLKTDRLRLYQRPAPEQLALRALKARRDDIQQMLIAETNRLEHADHAVVARSLKSHIRSLRTAFAKLEGEIAALLRATSWLARKAKLMQSVVGVGPITAATLLAYVPELGQLTKGEAARLTGLAPIARDSGKTSAPRHIEPGRAALRRTLYMAAGIAMRFNPVLRTFAARLKARGKPYKVVVTAVMRKLVVILNAILRDDQPCKHAKPA
jgi:transposase